MKDLIEIQFWKIARWLIIRGYGCNCKTSDLQDLSETYTKPEHVFHSSRCPSCRAKETLQWIDQHIELLKYY